MNVTWNLAFSHCIQEIVVVFIRKPVFSGSKGNSMPPPSFSCNDVLLPAFVLVQKVPPPTYYTPARGAFICPVRNEKEISIKMLSLLVCWGGKEQKWRHHGVHSTLLESALWKYQENSFCYGTECLTFDQRRQKEDRWRSADWKMQVVELLTEIE